MLRNNRGCGGPAPPGVVFHYHPGRIAQYASDILEGFEGTIQVDAYGAYTQISKPSRPGGKPLKLAIVGHMGGES